MQMLSALALWFSALFHANVIIYRLWGISSVYRQQGSVIVPETSNICLSHQGGARENAPHAPKTTNMNPDQPSYSFTITSTSLCNTAYQPTV